MAEGSVQDQLARELAAPPKERAGFNRPVHGARGLFAGAVFVFHVVNSGLATWPLLATHAAEFLTRTTEYGVELFFCISGFVIAGTLRRARSPATFLQDRAIRIFPVLWVSILVIWVLSAASGYRDYAAIPFERMAWLLPANLLAMPGILPLLALHPAAWSLSYEFSFYGICAAGWALRRRLGGRTMLALLALPSAVLVALYPRALFFVSGVLVAEAAARSTGRLEPGVVRAAPLARLSRYPVALLIVFLLAWREIQELSLPAHIIDTTMFQWMTDWRLPLEFIAFAAATLGFAGLAAGEGCVGRLLCTRAIQFMGTISYSFYLWSPIVMSILKQGMLRSGLAVAAGPAAQVLFLALSLPPSILISWASQRLLERGAGAWVRQRLHHRPSLGPVATPPPGPA
ncbi:MAG: acyltransferase [Acetobacteraceae bacterium]|nr:acyltransferase [Acetobacteraceae bacterium]